MRRRSEVAGRGGRPDNATTLKIPHDTLNEQVVLAAALVDPGARAELERVPPDHFFGDGHPELWAAVRECVRQKLTPDPATVCRLSGGKVAEEYVRQLMTARPVPPPNLGHNVSTLEWDRARVESVRGPIKQLLRSLQDPTTDPGRVRALSKAVAGSFEGHGERLRYLHDPAELVRTQMKELRSRRKRKAVYPYGIDGFDRTEDGRWRIIPGAAPGQVTVITAVPGAGKSTVACRMALSWIEEKRRILYGAWEAQGGPTLELMATMSLGWSRYRVTTGGLTTDEEDELEAEMARLSAWCRFWKMPWGRERGKRWTNDGALDDVHEHIADSGCEIFIADLWKRCLRSTRPEDEESALIRQQTIAEETRTHCVLVQQQRSKDIEQRHDKRPTREGIKGSSAWVEVADTIIGVHLPSLWKNVDDDTVELDILKQRWGKWPQAVEFDWDGDRGSFENGRTIDYDPPGCDRPKSDLDDWVEAERNENRPPPRKRGKKR